MLGIPDTEARCAADSLSPPMMRAAVPKVVATRVAGGAAIVVLGVPSSSPSSFPNNNKQAHSF